ncbi:MAG: hypothetical protein ABIE74_09145 [Pseudomonadota bacterium]
MSNACANLKIPAGINSSRTAYEWWLKIKSGQQLPSGKIDNQGLDISIFREKNKLKRFKRLISVNPALLKSFNRHVLSFVRDFRGDLNVDKGKGLRSADLITAKEVKALANMLFSEQGAEDVIVDISVSIYLMKNLLFLDPAGLKNSRTMREAYLISKMKGKNVIPVTLGTEYKPSMIGCFKELTKKNPKLLMDWKRTKREKDKIRSNSFHVLFKAMMPEIRKIKQIQRKTEIRKPLKIRETKKTKTARVLLGVALSIALILLLVLI